MASSPPSERPQLKLFMVDPFNCRFIHLSRLPGPDPVAGGLDKGGKKRVGPGRAALELRVKLAADHKGMVLDLGNLDQPAIRRQPRQHQPGLDQRFDLDADPPGFSGQGERNRARLPHPDARRPRDPRRAASDHHSGSIEGVDPDFEGDGTALYLAQTLKSAGVRVTRIARGVPAGSSIEYSNAAVLAEAVTGRRDVEASR